MKRTCRPLAALVAGAAFSLSAGGVAQAQQIPSSNGSGLDTHLVRPTMDSKGLFTTNGSDILGANEISFGLIIDYGRDLLRIDVPPGSKQSGALIDHSFQGTLQFNYGILNQFIAGIDLPLNLMTGQSISTEQGWSPSQLNS